jgi:hypothetical protein
MSLLCYSMLCMLTINLGRQLRLQLHHLQISQHETY